MSVLTYNYNPTPSNNPLWDGLLAYYTADNTPNDALGSYNGTLVNGATYGTGIVNQGFSLEGVNDYVSMGNVLDFDGSTPFSISLWSYPTSLNSYRVMISKIARSPKFEGWTLQTNGNKIRLFISSDYTTNNYIDITSITSLTLNSWQHIVLTYDGNKNTSGINMYLNSTNISFTTALNALTGSVSNSDILNIGSNTGSSSFYNGVIDEVSIFSKVLSPTEVTELYNGGVGKQYPN